MSCTREGKFYQPCLILPPTNVQLIAPSGPPEIWQDHQISRAGSPMVHCLEMSISRSDNPVNISANRSKNLVTLQFCIVMRLSCLHLLLPSSHAPL